ncbi:MAG: ABC transporter permease, partial [Nitrospirae bacterium]
DPRRLPPGPWRAAWRTFREDRLALAALILLLLLVAAAVAGKALTEWWPVLDPATTRLADRLRPPLSHASPDLPPGARPPFGVYLLGTDELGRDVLARMLQGASVSLSVGFIAVSISLAIGITLGGIAGAYGEVRLLGVSVDAVVMRFVEVMLCFPTFFLLLAAVALLPPSIYTIMAIIGATSWMGTARLVRAELLSLRERDFVHAARGLGLPEWRLLFRHLVPNGLAPVFVAATLGVADAILTESALSFLGFGVPPPYATWGNILADGRSYLFDAPWLTYLPGLAIFAVVLCFNLVGEGLREALNPRLRQGR